MTDENNPHPTIMYDKPIGPEEPPAQKKKRLAKKKSEEKKE